MLKHPQTLIHGDVRLHNMGLTDDQLVLLDWEVVGSGPPAMDFAWYLIISASRIDATREQVIDDYRDDRRRPFRCARMGSRVHRCDDLARLEQGDRHRRQP